MEQFPGFRKRFRAWGIDFAVMLVLALLYIPLNRLLPHVSFQVYSGLAAALGLLPLAYLVYSQGRWGQTLGKRITGLRLCLKDGSQITWRTVIRRYAPDALWFLVAATGWTTIVSSLPWSEFQESSVAERGRMMNAVMPGWYKYNNYVPYLWFLINVVVLRNSAHNRALHDHIGGTVVKYSDSQRNHT